MIKLTVENTKNAIARARAEAKNLVVRMTNAVRMYRVESKKSGNVYTVNFFVRDGERFGSCDCRAGQNGRYVCKHIAAAAGLNQTLAERGLLKHRSSVSVS